VLSLTGFQLKWRIIIESNSSENKRPCEFNLWVTANALIRFTPVYSVCDLLVDWFSEVKHVLTAQSIDRPLPPTAVLLRNVLFVLRAPWRQA
jgi:hypothetical protein